MHLFSGLERFWDRECVGLGGRIPGVSTAFSTPGYGSLNPFGFIGFGKPPALRWGGEAGPIGPNRSIGDIGSGGLNLRVRLNRKF
jgi:hypothetical protein